MKARIIATILFVLAAGFAHASLSLFLLNGPLAFISKNIITDYGAHCNGDFQAITRTVSIISGTKNLSTTIDTFVSGDVGKQIYVPGASGGPDDFSAIISTFTDARHVVVSTNAGATLSGASITLSFGTDDAPAFGSFNAFGITQGTTPITLTVPGVCQFLTAGNVGGSIGTHFVAGVRNLTINGTGAGSSSLSSPYAPAFFFLGQFGQTQCEHGIAEPNGCSARIQTVSAGSSTVQLTSASFGAGYLSRFTVGQFIIVAGIDTQGFGAPTNPFFFEYRLVASIDIGTGTLTLSEPLTYSYESTWPLYFDGGPNDADQGGPATIYALGPAWDSSVSVKNITIDQQQTQTYAWGRFARFENVTVTGGHCVIPTQNQTFTMLNSDATDCQIEVDKLVNQITWTNTPVALLEFQSGGSIERLDFSNSAASIGITGTPKKAFLTDASINAFKPGATCCGRTDEIVCTRCAITTFDTGGGASLSGVNGISGMSMTSGIITWPKSTGAPPIIGIPGTNGFWFGGGLSSATAFYVVDVTDDATNTYIQTNLSGGFPTFTPSVGVRIHPAPKFTCIDCTGDPQAVDLNGAPAAAPLFSYSSRTYDGTLQQPPAPTLWGNVTSIVASVTTAYTGASGSLTLQPTGQFLYTTVNNDFSTTNYLPAINVKNPGGAPHTVTVTCPSLLSCNAPSGTQSGDSGFALSEQVWWTGITSPTFSSNISSECPAACPSITVTVQTNQGVVNYLLKRDLDPASNDNSPVGLDQAA